MNIKRGDIVLVNLESVKGSEQGKTRPCLVIQNNTGNTYSPTTIVAAITSNTQHQYPFTTFVSKGNGNLPKDSVILCNQIRTISTQDRIQKKMGALKPEIMEKVNQALKESLALA